MPRILLALCLLLPAISFGQTAVTGSSVTMHFDPVTTAFDGTPLSGPVTYNVYASPGCGQKALVANPQFVFSPMRVTVTIPAAPGCLSVAVSASNSAGEGDISSTITFQVTAPVVVLKPARVAGLAPGP